MGLKNKKMQFLFMIISAMLVVSSNAAGTLVYVVDQLKGYIDHHPGNPPADGLNRGLDASFQGSHPIENDEITPDETSFGPKSYIARSRLVKHAATVLTQ